MNTNNFYKKYVKPYEKYEVEASERIKKHFSVNIVGFNNNSDFDFIDEKEVKYEVKYDGYSNVSNNFFIEFLGYGKATGINITQAKYYIITDGNIYSLILTKKLKKLIKNCPIKFTKDGSTAGYIIDKNIIISNSTLI